LNPKNSISGLVKEVKVSSGDFINDKKWLRGKFHWQEGYGAFSFSHSQIDAVVKYILNQEKHHKRNVIQGRIFKDIKIIRC
jgi:REP element-mobilizing transposase RayT